MPLCITDLYGLILLPPLFILLSAGLIAITGEQSGCEAEMLVNLVFVFTHYFLSAVGLHNIACQAHRRAPRQTNKDIQPKDPTQPRHRFDQSLNFPVGFYSFWQLFSVWVVELGRWCMLRLSCLPVSRREMVTR